MRATTLGNQCTTTTASANSILTNADHVGLSGLSDAQWQHLIVILSAREQAHGPKLKDMFLNHMIGSLQYFYQVRSMSSI